jgi:hypothetical protein
LLEGFGKAYAGERLECSEQNLMSDCDGKLRRSNADRNVDSKDHAHEVSDKNENSIGNLTRQHACDIVANNLSKFCPKPKTLWKLCLKMY